MPAHRLSNGFRALFWAIFRVPVRASRGAAPGRRPRVGQFAAYALGLAVLVGGLAFALGGPAHRTDGTQLRGDHRASRGEVRIDPTTPPAPVTPSPTPAVLPPSLAPTTPVPVTTAPRARAVPAPKVGPPTVVAAGCSGYTGNRLVACNLLPSFGFATTEMAALDPMWDKESGWSISAANPSGAYGIPQALPGSKMATAGSDWRTNPATQISWGLSYIKSRYGSPAAAWSYWQAHGWY